MEFGNFRNQVCEKMKEKLGADYNLSAHDVLKVNHVLLRGILVKKNKSKIVPMIYLEDSYTEYMNDESSMDEIVESLIETIKERTLEAEIESDILKVTSWERAKDMVLPKLINTEKNKDLLHDFPHRNMENLSVVYYLDLEMKGEMAGINISNHMANQYGVDEETLYKQAIKNMTSDMVHFRSMNEMIRIMSNGSVETGDNTFMYVLTNYKQLYGAATIVAPWVRSSLVNYFDGPVYLLPSSLHEWIVIKKGSEDAAEHLCSIVKEVNSEEVKIEDYLADNVYELTSTMELKLVA